MEMDWVLPRRSRNPVFCFGPSLQQDYFKGIHAFDQLTDLRFKEDNENETQYLMVHLRTVDTPSLIYLK